MTALRERLAQMGDGLYQKYTVTRTDGSSGPGGKHEHCDYFVLDWKHDRFAIAAARAYADACESEYPDLAEDLRERARVADLRWKQEEFK